MRILIIALFALGVCLAQAACGDNEFVFNGECISCDKSPCEKCQGSASCKECPQGIVLSPACDTCKTPGYIVVNKECVACDHEDIGAKPGSGDGTYCECPADDNGACCKKTGYYKRDGNCHSCSAAILGCTGCSYEAPDIKCTECGEDFDLKDGECAWNSATHLLAAGGVLISLLILV